MTDHGQAVLELADRAAAADGVHPLNESAELVVTGQRAGRVLLEQADGDVVGFAVLDPREATIVLAVDPQHRRRGHGSALLQRALSEAPDHSVWAFGTLPAAEALAERAGLVPARGLLKLGRGLADEPVGPIPEGHSVTTWTPAESEAVVAVNAAAFAHHPEQGKLTLAEFNTLTQQPWFSADGLFLAKRGADVVGFHWTKRHDDATGEVYVLAVHPDHGGAGLGRLLLETGLAHLERIGCTSVILYVEAAQERVVNLYRSAGFETVNLDTSYRRKDQ